LASTTSAAAIAVKYNGNFWLHLFVTALSWFIPFLFTWKLVLAAYSVVLLQFLVFGGCLMNRGHALEDRGNDHTFYGHLLECAGVRLNRARVKRFVRLWIYVVLGSIALLWQLGLGKAPLIF
jgi:hypothetical protein